MISGCTMESFEDRITLAEHVLLEQHDDAEHHGGGAHDGGADEHRLGGGLEGVAGAVALLQLVLGVLEVGLEAEVLLDLGGDAGRPSIWLSS
jgi:hypothetical protein